MVWWGVAPAAPQADVLRGTIGFNERVARRAGLKLSAQLLSVATAVF